MACITLHGVDRPAAGPKEPEGKISHQSHILSQTSVSIVNDEKRGNYSPPHAYLPKIEGV